MGQYHRVAGTMGQGFVVGVRSLWVPSAGVFRVIFDSYPWYTIAESVTREEILEHWDWIIHEFEPLLTPLNRWASYAMLFFTENIEHGRCQVDQIRETAFPQITPTRSLINMVPDEDDLQDRDECLVCYENPPNTVIVPCGHQALCDKCASTHQFQECPFCREPIP